MSGDLAEDPEAERPDMPIGYGVDEGSMEGTLPWSFVERQMAAARNYWVISARSGGKPHAMPVWGLWLDGAFYFSTDRASQKGRNLKRRPDLVVHLESGDDVVILEGKAEELHDQATLDRFVEAYDAKYQFRPDPGADGAVTYRLRAEKALAWREQDFPHSATRWWPEEA